MQCVAAALVICGSTRVESTASTTCFMGRSLTHWVLKLSNIPVHLLKHARPTAAPHQDCHDQHRVQAHLPRAQQSACYQDRQQHIRSALQAAHSRAQTKPYRLPDCIKRVSVADPGVSEASLPFSCMREQPGRLQQSAPESSGAGGSNKRHLGSIADFAQCSPRTRHAIASLHGVQRRPGICTAARQWQNHASCAESWVQ